MAPWKGLLSFAFLAILSIKEADAHEDRKEEHRERVEVRVQKSRGHHEYLYPLFLLRSGELEGYSFGEIVLVEEISCSVRKALGSTSPLSQSNKLPFPHSIRLYSVVSRALQMLAKVGNDMHHHLHDAHEHHRGPQGPSAELLRQVKS